MRLWLPGLHGCPADQSVCLGGRPNLRVIWLPGRPGHRPAWQAGRSARPPAWMAGRSTVTAGWPADRSCWLSGQLALQPRWQNGRSTGLTGGWLADGLPSYLVGCLAARSAGPAGWLTGRLCVQDAFSSAGHAACGVYQFYFQVTAPFLKINHGILKKSITYVILDQYHSLTREEQFFSSHIMNGIYIYIYIYI